MGVCSFRVAFVGTSVLLGVSGVASAQTVGLGGAWSEFDPLNFHSLSGQSAAGFTATHAGVATQGPERPRIYQEFGAIDFGAAEIGNTIAMQFDVLFNTVPASNDTDFRFGLADTSTNSIVTAMYDLGTASGSSVRARYDDDITNDFADPPGPLPYSPGNWNDALEAGSTLANTGGSPNGQSINNTTTTHSFELLLTRTADGFDVTQLWRNDATPSSNPEIAVNYSFDYLASASNYRATPAINSIDGVAFALMDNDPFGPGGSGSYTVSGVAVKNLGLGDVQLDGVFNALDIDAMYDAIQDAAAYQTSASLTEAQLTSLSDLSGDDAIDADDLDDLLQDVFGTGFGDVNLDGVVNITDLNIASGNENNPGGWADGDQNGDDVVDSLDLAIIQDAIGEFLTGDYDGSGFVSQSDLDLVLLNWGDSTVPAEWVATEQFDGVQVSQNELDGVLLNWGDGTPPNVAVPEPASGAVLTLALTGLMMRQSRRKTA